MDEERLFMVCFALAEDLMWEMNTAPIEKLPDQLKELSEMTDKFMALAMENFYMIENIENGQEVLFSAIKYLNALAIPPLRGNYNWFDYSLGMLLELANPNSSPGKDGLPYLHQAKAGINQIIDWANQNDDED